MNSKLKHFLNPKPSEIKKSGAHLDASEDIYDHTKDLFLEEKNGHDQQNTVGRKRIHGEIELDQKIYSSKKVARKQIEMSSDEDNVQQSSDDDSSDQVVASESDEITKEQQFLQKTFNNLQDNDEKQIDENLDKIVSNLQKKQKKTEEQSTSTFEEEFLKAQSMKMQKKIWDRLLLLRINQEKVLKKSYQLPSTSQYSDLLFANNPEFQINKRKAKSYLKNLIRIQKDLYLISENQEIQFSDLPRGGGAADLFHVVDSNFQGSIRFIEDTVKLWNERNQIVSSQKMNEFNKGIVNQVNNIMGDSITKQKIILKSQVIPQSELINNILGDFEHNLDRKTDSNIYNDSEFYQQLLNDLLNSQQEVDTTQDQDQELLFGADLSLTQKFIAKKERIKEIMGNKDKKEIDRKATKGRKIKYIVHEKLLNFMVPIEHHSYSLSPLDPLDPL